MRSRRSLFRFLTLLLVPEVAIGTFARRLFADNAATKQVDAEAFDKLRQEKDAVVVDVRSPEEYAAGHIPGAVNVPVTGKGSEGFAAKIVEVTKGKKPLVHCRSGVRSAIAVKKMAELKIGPVVDFPGGWVAWSQAGKPVEKGKAQ